MLVLDIGRPFVIGICCTHARQPVAGAGGWLGNSLEEVQEGQVKLSTFMISLFWCFLACTQAHTTLCLCGMDGAWPGPSAVFDSLLSEFNVGYFMLTRAVYEELGKYGDVENQILCRQRLEELDPSIRYCNYKMGLSNIQGSDLLDLSTQDGPGLDLLQSKLEVSDSLYNQCQGLLWVYLVSW